MFFFKYVHRTFLLQVLIVTCCCNIHVPLFRVIPPQNFDDNELDISSKSLQSSSHKFINLIQSTLKGSVNTGYYISLGVGTPPQKFNFIIDTGSSNLALAGQPQTYVTKYFRSQKSSSFHNYGIKISLPYESGSWNGVLGSDIFTFDGASSEGINKSDRVFRMRSNFSVIHSSSDFFLRNSSWQGILGLAYSVLSQPMNVGNRNTLFDNLVINTNILDLFSVVLCGLEKENMTSQTHGFFIAGGMNPALFTGPMIHIMIRRRWFYEIIISSISVSNMPIIISSCQEYNRDKTIFDTGTTDTLLPTHVFRSLVLSIVSNMRPHPFPLLKFSAFWDRKAVLCTAPSNKLPPPIYFPEVNFHLVINDTASLRVALSPQQYIAYVGDQIDKSGKIRNCYKLGFGESKSGTILGGSFMEGFYLAFNRVNDTIGIAQSACNNRYPGMARSRITKVYTDQGGLMSCAVMNDRSSGLFSLFTTGVTLVVGLIFGIVLLFALLVMLGLQCRDRDELAHVSHSRSTTRYESLD